MDLKNNRKKDFIRRILRLDKRFILFKRRSVREE